jgi:hypothetical protein
MRFLLRPSTHAYRGLFDSHCFCNALLSHRLSLKPTIHIYNFDITDEQAIAKNFKKIEFDVIIDDGSHVCSDIIKTFKLLFSKLKPGGIFLIEDLHTSYWKSHGGSYLGTDSAIEFFKKFADLLNFYHINDQQFDQKLSDADRFIFQWLRSISFYDKRNRYT